MSGVPDVARWVGACILIASCSHARDGEPRAAARSESAVTPAVPAAPAPPPTARTPEAPPVAAEPASPGGDPPEIAHPYEEGVDAQARIDAAVAASRADGKRVLLVFGANWCPWCRRLEHTLQNDARIAAELRDHFHLVHVDTGVRRSDTNAAVVTRYGNPVQLGLPVLVVLGADGSVAHTQETGALEEGDRHSPTKIIEFLARMRS